MFPPSVDSATSYVTSPQTPAAQFHSGASHVIPTAYSPVPSVLLTLKLSGALFPALSSICGIGVGNGVPVGVGGTGVTDDVQVAVGVFVLVGLASCPSGGVLTPKVDDHRLIPKLRARIAK